MQYITSDHTLGGAVDLPLRTLPRQHRHLILLGIDADPVAADVVGHDEIQILSRELFLGVLDQRLGLGGEADQQALPSLSAELGQDVRSFSESKFQRAPPLLDLCLPSLRNGCEG